MLHTDLLKIINSRDAWAFVGSGPSNDAGCPSWDALLEQLGSDASRPGVAQLLADAHFDQAKREDLPFAFQLAEQHMTRDGLEASIRASLNACRSPGQLHQILAELPFAGYITTNYDGLLEKALDRVDAGWIPVGNVGDEVRKASGTAERVVWHIHGAADLSAERSRLILTQEDYEQLYLDESRVMTQLRGLMANRRIVVVGFGMRDHDVMEMMRRVGRLTDATRPVYALVEKTGKFRHTIDRQVFLRQYKVDVQPYRNDDGRHLALRQLLSVYASLSLRRSLRFGRHLSAAPQYDPETTSLLIYNDLVLERGIQVPQDLRTSILKSRILASLEADGKTGGAITAELTSLLDALIRRLSPSSVEQDMTVSIETAIQELRDDNLITVEDGRHSLTASGRDVVLDHGATSERLEDQFRASLRARVERLAAPVGAVVTACVDVVEAFIRTAVDRRALGVALTFATGGAPAQQDYHTLALLQSIGDWLDKTADEVAALVVVETIQELFRSPTSAEASYIATAIQARFVLHILGMDDDAIAIRMRELSDSLFLIDASTLIPWLATGSVGNDAATHLLQRLQDAGALVATTSTLIEEVAEHARWAQRTVAEAGGVQTTPVLEAATGRAGIKSNAFLEGYFQEYGSGHSAPSFDAYLAACLRRPIAASNIADAYVKEALTSKGVSVVDFDEVSSEDASMAADRGMYEDRIRERRMGAASFRHDRQVLAEAQATVLVERARGGTLGEISGRSVSNGQFISNTTMLNRVARSPLPVTMRPESAISWLATLQPASKEDSKAIISELLWELEERRMNIVDQASLLATFGPLVAAAQEQLSVELPKYRALVSQRYGGGEGTLSPVDALSAPVVLDSVLQDRVADLERLVALQEAQLAALAESTPVLPDPGDSERDERKARNRERYLRRMGRA